MFEHRDDLVVLRAVVEHLLYPTSAASWPPTSNGTAPLGARPPRLHEIHVESAAMASGETMPRRYTPDGHNVLLPIAWRDLSEGTREIAVVGADFGAGSPPRWAHWIVYGNPATTGGLPESR